MRRHRRGHRRARRTAVDDGVVVVEDRGRIRTELSGFDGAPAVDRPANVDRAAMRTSRSLATGRAVVPRVCEDASVPQQCTPPFTTAHDDVPPLATTEAGPGNGTRRGRTRVEGSSGAAWPSWFRPQHHTSPFAARAQLWCVPAAIAWTFSSPAISTSAARRWDSPEPLDWPSMSSPQHDTRPDARRMHVWLAPAAMATASWMDASAAPASAWNSSFVPMQSTRRSRMAHACDRPSAPCEVPSSSGARVGRTSPGPSSQHDTRPCASAAQVRNAPRANHRAGPDIAIVAKAASSFCALGVGERQWTAPDRESVQTVSSAFSDGPTPIWRAP